ncbi:protein FAM92A [Diaphorina citri]|uniref:Protein FAM92A n=1 Tax=Diaphorina citri TaxID=121845 RepID=A0A1S3D5E4_DIACI|nr:protein FAM92A [Diaphorina citri]
MSGTSHTIKKGIDLRELQAKFIQNRTSHTEKNIAELCRVLTGYTLNHARLRDSSDHVSQVLAYMSEAETVSKSLAQGLRKLSLVMSQLGDSQLRDSSDHVSQVLAYMSEAETEVNLHFVMCKIGRKSIVKNGTKWLPQQGAAFSKESTRRKECEKLRQRNPRSPQMNTQAETDYAKAQAEVTRKLKIIEEKMQVFEEQKIKDIKLTLHTLILAQIRHHAKALELFTQGYKYIEDISEQDDLQSFMDILSEPQSIHRLETVKKITASNSSLNTIAGLFRGPFPEQQVAESEVTPVHEIQDKNNDHDDEEEDSTARTNSSKSQSTSLVQKIKSLAT